jgi:hypothetical protein
VAFHSDATFDVGAYTLVRLILGQAVEAMAPQNPIDGLIGNHDLMVTQQIHANAPWAHVVVLAQIQDLLHNLWMRRTRAMVWRMMLIAQPSQTLSLVTATPAVEQFTADAVAPTGLGYVATGCSLLKHLQASFL